MSHPDDEAFVDLAINGHDAADVPSSVRQHLDSCATCALTLTDLRRTLSFASPSASDAVWVAPPAALWERIAAQIDEPSALTAAVALRPATTGSQARTADTDANADADGTGLRHLDPQTAQPATESPLERRRARRARDNRRRPRRVGWAAGIAAAGLVVGLLTGRALWNNPAPSAAATPATVTTSPVSTISQVALDTLDPNNPKQLGQAAVLRTQNGFELKIDTTAKVDVGGGYLEVWLINRDLKRMVSVGVLRENGVATFPISQNLIDQGYVVVDISLEQFDDNSVHSGDSVMRGKLPA